VNRFFRGIVKDTEAVQSLAAFERFPARMWRSAEVLDFVSWLREYDDGVPSSERKTGFFGRTHVGGLCRAPLVRAD